MLPRTRIWLVTLGLLVLIRIVGMILIPVTDTSEARYAEIARLMMVSNDYVTPWFEANKPFWGKPPLAFWSQALSASLLGLSEFSLRLPSLAIAIVVGGLTYLLAKSMYGESVGRWAVLILASSPLFYLTSGAILTDPAFLLGTTLGLAGGFLALTGKGKFWYYGAIAGVAISLLSKGPIGLVIVGGPICIWLAFYRKRIVDIDHPTLIRSAILLSVLTIPWYWVAEMRTPGFLQYFLIGENFLRFVMPGWAGDLYGNAHRQPYGTIWLYLGIAILPWAVLALALFKWIRDAKVKWRIDKRPSLEIGYLCSWVLFPLAFFSFARNILWTYVLPVLPALAILLAVTIARVRSESVARGGFAIAIGLPFVAIFFAALAIRYPERLKTERDMVEQAFHKGAEGTPLIYVDTRPFSARFYSKGEAKLVTAKEAEETIRTSDRRMHFAVPKESSAKFEERLHKSVVREFANRRYVLFETVPKTLTEAISNE